MDQPTFNKMLNQESENLAKKIFLDICCDGCACQGKHESQCLCGNESCNC